MVRHVPIVLLVRNTGGGGHTEEIESALQRKMPIVSDPINVLLGADEIDDADTGLFAEI